MFGNRLLPRVEHLARSLSYANRRRLEIARALVSQPELLLLDEPTAGMNPAETLELMDQIRSLRERGMTILLIEHKLNVVNEICRHGDRARPRREDRRGPARGSSAATRRSCVAYLVRSATAAAAPLLEFKDVDTYYGELHVLKRVNYRVDEGEIVCLLGGNASGKSTTMKTVLGLVRPRSGTVSYAARSSTRSRPPSGSAAASRPCPKRAACSRA